ncbi:MAG TPA: Rne/Rng family ribonuclease, partial [Steroidobacteraceae bacterium]|nr:Rne/Rng family ribonuclease [Steroidobacteraceae bacterium]
VSRRIEGEERDQMREVMGQLQIPDGMGAIVRTAGVGRAVAELQWDLDNLKVQWEQIAAAAKDRPAPFLVFRESDAVTRAMRDYLSDDVGEVLVDSQAAFDKAQEYMQRFMPAEAQRRLKLYTDDIPLFTRFQIESQIESAYAHKVQLPSGGSIVIDYTEALVSIDINSARATRGSDIETTATNTNLEAADEIARQLRIRDIGGLIVIDFIDMESSKNQRDVEDRLRDAMKMDRARIQIGRLSRFGLLEMSRQRLRPSLGESSHIVCPRCVGIGSIRSVESMALAVLRLIGEELRKDRTARVIAQVPVAVATYLINEKREWLRTLEDKSDVDLLIVPNENMQTPEYSIRRVRDDEIDQPENRQATYLMPTAPEVAEPGAVSDKKPPAEPPAVASLLPATPAPIVAAPAPAHARASFEAPAGGHDGFWSRLKRLLVGEPAEPGEPSAAPQVPGGSRREAGQHRDSRREPRHGRYADGARRERGEGRRGDGRDRDHRRREGRGSERGREHSRGGRDRFPDRGGERGGERGGTERSAPGRSDLNPPNGNRAAADAAAPPGEMRSEQGERLDRPERGERRGRRGRRRGRRGGGGGGGGGVREGGVGQPPAGIAAGATASEPAGGLSGNGGHEVSAMPASPPPASPPPAPPAERPRDMPEPAERQFHSEPRESGAAHEPAPIAHFEPTPRPEPGAPQAKPYVVWSSTPAKEGGREPEE